MELVIILGFPSVVCPSSIGAAICAVHTADAVATGEVNCNNITVRLRSLPRLAEAIIQGYCSAAQRPLTDEDGTRRYLCHLKDSSVPCGQGQAQITCQRKHLLSAASSVSLYYTAVDRQCRHRWLSSPTRRSLRLDNLSLIDAITLLTHAGRFGSTGQAGGDR